MTGDFYPAQPYPGQGGTLAGAAPGTISSGRSITSTATQASFNSRPHNVIALTGLLTSLVLLTSTTLQTSAGA